MHWVQTPDEAVALLAGRRTVSAELMYRPRPPEGRERVVFDFTLRSRLAALDANDAVLLLCDSAATADSLVPLIAPFSELTVAALVVNPVPFTGMVGETPRQWGWDDPDGWQRFQTTDRWARINAALEVAARVGGDG